MILRDGGYDVTVACTYQEALNSIKATHFDMAIVDIGWSGDKSLPRKDCDSAGWAICDAIEEADKGTAPPPTFQIVLSHRFDENPQLAMIAAEKSKLPFYKSYSEANRISLLAAVKYIEKDRSNPSARDLALERARASEQIVKRSLDEALDQERRWTTVTMGLVTAKRNSHLGRGTRRDIWICTSWHFDRDQQHHHSRNFSTLVRPIEDGAREYQGEPKGCRTGL